MDVGIFLSIFGALAAFSLVFTIAFLKPSARKNNKLNVDTSWGYPKFMGLLFPMFFALLLFTQIFVFGKDMDSALLLLLLGGIVYGSLT